MPEVCFGCNTHLRKGERILCTLCRNNLPLTEYDFIDENPIDRDFFGKVNVKKASSLLFFAEKSIVRNFIHQLKYKNQENIGVFLGDWYGQVLKEDMGLGTIDFIVPVPLHKKKLRKRGYNQLDLFGKRLAYHLNTVFKNDVLIKTANTRTQTKKGRLFRWQNTRDLYILEKPKTFEGKTILLIDDVITTGATLEACSLALHEAKNVKILIATMAVAL